MSRGMYYVLDEHGEPLPIDDVLAWGEWFEASTRDRRRVIAHDRDEGEGGVEILVSTVFLALDHSYGSGPPVLWETLVIGGLLDGEMRRYTSREAALAGHQEICRRVAASLGK